MACKTRLPTGQRSWQQPTRPSPGCLRNRRRRKRRKLCVCGGLAAGTVRGEHRLRPSEGASPGALDSSRLLSKEPGSGWDEVPVCAKRLWTNWLTRRSMAGGSLPPQTRRKAEAFREIFSSHTTGFSCTHRRCTIRRSLSWGRGSSRLRGEGAVLTRREVPARTHPPEQVYRPNVWTCRGTWRKRSHGVEA